MPFCPECTYEYKESVKTCPECKVDLIEKLPEVGTTEDYIELYMVSNRMEADVVISLLTEHGISVLVRDLRSFPVLPDFGRRARLRIAVIPEKVEEAKKLLQEGREDGALTSQGRFL